MATEISLANVALTICGAGGGRITSRADNNKYARAVDAVFDHVRDVCQSMANWHFCLSRITLAATTAQDGYTYAYIIPSDTLRLVEIRENWVGVPLLGARYISEIDSDFVIEENRVLLTNFAPDLKVRVTKRVENVALWGPLFCDYFAQMLAVYIFEDVSRGGAAKLQEIKDNRDKALVMARNNNAIQEAPQETEDTSWILARVGP